jgi:hypothetical protein
MDSILSVGSGVLAHSERFVPKWHLPQAGMVGTFKQHVANCKLLLCDQDARLHTVGFNLNLQQLHDSSVGCASMSVKGVELSPLILMPTLKSAKVTEEPVCYVAEANPRTLCYFLCVPAALEQGFVPHLFVELDDSNNVKRTFSRTNRVRNPGLRLVRPKSRLSVHVTENTWETIAVRGLTLARFGEADGLAWRTRLAGPFRVQTVLRPGDDGFNAADSGFTSYKGSWAGGPCFNFQDFITVPEDCEVEEDATVANWEIAYLVVVALVYLFIVILMVARAFWYLKR